MGPYPRTFLLLLTVVAVMVPATTSACPFCEGGPSGTNEVKEAIFGEGFLGNLVAVGLPFLFVFALTLAVHGLPTGQKHPKDTLSR